ncbi:MAG: extracellular solute-binding protein [Eubacteriales bacterium]|nr:extracellular solute-binding protein [Eubacteriales bacterium]
MRKNVVFMVTAIVVVLILAVQIIFMPVKRKHFNETTEDTQDTVTLKWYINYSWFDTDWGQNLVSRRISEETGVNIEFVVPKGNEKEKMKAMINLETLPDLVTLGWWEKENQKMISENQVYPLNELADQYAPEFYEVIDETVAAWHTSSDGNLYAYPSYPYSYEEFKNQKKLSSNENFLVRKDIYEAIGSPDMTTPEGFVSAVKKAAEMFPEVDGEPLIPIGASEFDDSGNDSFDIYLQNSLAVPCEENGGYYDRNTDEEYIRWLKILRQLGEEGYLKNEIFVDKRKQLEEKLVQGRYFCLFYQSTDIADQQKEIYSTSPERIYIAVDGPRNADGDDPTLPVTSLNGWTLTYISRNCQAPDKAIKLLSYLLSEEGQMLTYLGEEGSMYEIEDGRVIEKPEVLELLNTDREEYDRVYGADSAYWMLQNYSILNKWSYNKLDCIEQLSQWAYPYSVYGGQYELSFHDDEEMSMIQTNLDKMWANTLPALLLAESEQRFDEILAEYIAEREENRYAEFCEAATEMIQSNKEKLGMEE